MTADRRTPPPERPHPSKAEARNGTSSGLAKKRDVEPWPQLASEDQWAIELMSDLLESTEQEPVELRARAAKLRKAAHEGDPGQRAAALALADRYDQAASRHKRGTG